MLIAAVLATGPARTEAICVDGGVAGSLGIGLPAICVPIP
jgi:hypothetical protein